MTFSSMKRVVLGGLMLWAVLLYPFTSHAEVHVVSGKQAGTGAQAAAADQSAVLLYGSFEELENGRTELMSLYSLLRGYCTKVSLVRLEDYQSGLLSEAQVVFIAGAVHEKLQDKLGQDLQSFGGTITWIGGGLELYAKYGLLRGFQVSGYTNDFGKVSYRFSGGNGTEETILIGQTRFAPKLEITDASLVQVFGTLTDGARNYPYALRSGKVWQISLFGNDGANGRVFRDLLSRVFEREPYAAPQVYIKLTDISPFADFAKLEESAEWLRDQGVPFIVELRPVFMNTDYEHMENFFQMVRGLQQRGGAPVLGNLIGWNPPDEWQPYIEGYSPKTEATTVPEKLIHTAISAYMQHHIYPAAFSGPPDLLFDPELTDVTAYFSTFIQSSAWKGYARDRGPDTAWKGTYIPNLTRAPEGTENLVQPQLSKGEIAGVLSFDGSTEGEQLKEAVLYLKKIGATFNDLLRLDSRITFEDKQIEISRGIVTVNGKRPFDEEGNVVSEAAEETLAELSGVNKRIKQTMFFVFIVAGVFIAFFVIAFIAGKKIDRKKHLR
jgi:hypothetical protein